MALDPAVMKAVEQLGYRVTVGDVASQAGMNVQLAEQGLLALASETGGHMQVSETGEIAYLFPPNFRAVLQGKYLRLRLQEWWQRIWRVLFYCIRISFGIILLLSILLIVLTIIAILIALSSSRSSDDQGNESDFGGTFSMPNVWLGPDWYWIFLPDFGDRPSPRHRKPEGERMGFLEAIYSFLFGDGDPNANLEERRWQAIATTIRNHGGAIVAEQIAPYLDDLGSPSSQEFEDYMLPVLTRFNGRPAVSPTGQLVYYFPDLQVTAEERRSSPVAAYLRELPWRFSKASSGQIMAALGLGVFNVVAALVLGRLLVDPNVQEIIQQTGGLPGFVAGIYGILLAYGTGFLAIPLVRYFWVQARNKQIESRNAQRALRAEALNAAGDTVLRKLDYAKQFAAMTVVNAADAVYSTERDLTEQELERKDQIDAEWQQRLEQSGS